jgi:multidrug efflux pump subunit AcrB
MMWLVRIALKRPYTFVVMAVLIAILGISSILLMPTDIFPSINIPVVSIIWTYTGVSPDDMAKRVVTICERALTTTVNDIQHMESRAYNGVSVIRVYFQPKVVVEMAIAQITSLVQTILRPLPPGIFPPLIIKYDASSVPILQLGLSSKTLTEQQLFDFGQNFIRTDLATIEGAAVPLPYGGKSRAIMVDLDPQALYANQLSASDISDAVSQQSLILPAGTAKIGMKEYLVRVNSSPDTAEEFNNLPVKTVDGATVYLKDIGHVRDGFSVQTNIVRQDGTRGALLTVLKNGDTSTLSIVSDVKKMLPKIKAGLPAELNITPLFDQSVFVRASVYGVAREAAIAALLTGLMILLFLGSLRSTLIVCISIPLSILTSIIVLNRMGQSINVMTLGGLALAVGILVDDATVEIENTNRNIAMKKPLVQAILDGAEQIATPALVSTLSICLVFVPVLLLTGSAKYLFTPLAMAVVFAMLTSYLLSRTLVPTLVHHLLRPELPRLRMGEEATATQSDSLVWRVHVAFDRRFEHFRNEYRKLLAWVLDNRRLFTVAFLMFAALSLFLVFFVGRDFFPTVDAGLIRLHVRSPAGTRIEETEVLFARIEREIRQIIPAHELDTILDNIGLPTSGVNLAFSDSATLGSGDGDILVSLKEAQHGPTADYIRQIRTMIHEKFPGVTCFFQPADITTQILNFGLPAAIDVQVSGRDIEHNYQIAQQIKDRIAHIPGTVDVNVFQEVNYPEINIDVDRTKASQIGLTQRGVASSMLVSLSSSGQTAPNQWLNPQNGVSYSVQVQTPQYRIDSLETLLQTPITSGSGFGNSSQPGSAIGLAPSQASIAYANPNAASNPAQYLDNLATTRRGTSMEAIDHYNIRPVFDIYASVDQRDLGSVSQEVKKIMEEFSLRLAGGSTLDLRGQARTMDDSFFRLGVGILFAIVLVYLLMAVNFQSWVDPSIVLSTIPGALAGILWMLFLTRTTLSVPSLMGAIMTIGVATANAILLITFANDEQLEGKDPLAAALSAGYVRIRPVLMTATAMILGMLPMALGLGEGGEQNAPLGRAVIGGLLIATVSTLLFLPVVYSYLRKGPPIDFDRRIEEEARGVEPA